MATDLYADFSNQYSNVAAKLKKRFLRKPNLQEVRDEFLVLANQCMDSEQPAIAAQTFIMASKCENMMGDFIGEAEFLVAAARQFMKEEQKLASLKCFSPGRENVESAIGCYMQAVTRYPEDSPLRVALYLELASTLVRLGVFIEAISFYEQAIDMFPQEAAARTIYMMRIMDLHIQMENHKPAFEVCSQLCEMGGSWKTKTIEREILINGIFLTLLVEPPQEKMPQCIRNIFTNLESDNDSLKTDIFEPDLCVKIESMLISYTTKDVNSLWSVYSESSTCLTLLQRDMFERLIRKLEKSFH